MELLVGIAVGAVGLMAWSIRRFASEVRSPRDRARLHLRKLRRARASDVHSGKACAVVGRALASDEPVVAPVSGVECLAWELRVWIVVGSESALAAASAKVARFDVQDETGSVRVDPEGAVPLLRSFEATPFDGPLPPEVVAAIDSKKVRRISSRGYLEEAVLRADETVVVGGPVQVEVDPTALPTDYRTAATRSVFRSGRRLPVCLSNDPQIVKG